MANFYLDNSDLKHHLNHPLMKKLVALRERNYSDAEKYDYAPFNFEDAMDSYEKVLEIAGEISGEIVAANAEDVDHEGPHVVDGHVVYAKGTQKNLDALVKAGLMGISIPRRYNGLNFSLVPYIMAAPKPFTNLPMKNKSKNTCRAFAPAKLWRWTSPNPMPVPTCKPSCSKPHTARPTVAGISTE